MNFTEMYRRDAVKSVFSMLHTKLTNLTLRLNFDFENVQIIFPRLIWVEKLKFVENRNTYINLSV